MDEADSYQNRAAVCFYPHGNYPAAVYLSALARYRSAVSVKQLEDGLYSMEYHSDYSLNDFLEQGGKASDMAVADFALADTAGRAVVVEYVNNEMSVVETPIATNFYLTPGEKYGIGT